MRKLALAGLLWAPTAVAGTLYVPGAGEFGSLLVEDQWPNAGDFDFNDVVIRYNWELTDDGTGAITNAVLTVDVAALGAQSVCSGLALRLPIATTSLTSATVRVGTATTGAPWGPAVPLTPTTSNGQPVLWISDDLRADVFAGQPGFVNTEATPAVDGQPLAITLAFIPGTSLVTADYPLDLFVHHCGDRSVQIHRPAYGGTDEADPGLFGTGDDASDTGIFYVQEGTGVPFVLHIGEGEGANAMDDTSGWPIERARVDLAWPGILAFAASGGDTHSDFYADDDVVGALIYGDAPTLVTYAAQADLVDGGGHRRWSDGTYAASCKDYRFPPAGHGYSGLTGSGVYRVAPPSQGTFDVYCDMTTDGGGWTLMAQGYPEIGGSLCSTGAVGTLDLDGETVTATAKLSDGQINALWSPGRELMKKAAIDSASHTPTFTRTCRLDFKSTYTFSAFSETPVSSLENTAVTCFTGTWPYAGMSESLAGQHCGPSFKASSDGYFGWSIDSTYPGGACGSANGGRSWLGPPNYGCNVTQHFIR